MPTFGWCRACRLPRDGATDCQSNLPGFGFVTAVRVRGASLVWIFEAFRRQGLSLLERSRVRDGEG